MMARCMQNEENGRSVFYGAMIAEGIIAMVWAAAGMAFYQGIPGLAEALAAGGPSAVVHTITTSLLGPAGGVLAMLGVIACPITSGDTAFRGARLMLADTFKIQQLAIPKRLLMASPCSPWASVSPSSISTSSGAISPGETKLWRRSPFGRSLCIW